MMSTELFIAWRYLRSKRTMGFITIISLISILGVMIGNAALIIVLSVFNGFNGLVTSLLVGFDPHIRIEKVENAEITEYDYISKILNQEKAIKAYSPTISEKAMIIAGSINRVIVITGVDDEKIGEVSGLKDKIIHGKLEFDDTDEVKDIVLGYTLADRIGVIKGDTIYLASSSGMEGGLLQFAMPKVFKFRLVGLFESDNKDYDNYYAYISIDAAKILFGNNYKGIDIRLDNIDKSEPIKEKLISQLPEDYVVSSWYDLHKDLYSIMKIERWIAYIILCLIIAVATFNILGSLTMTVIEKKRDIGILKSFGCSKKSISRIFRLQGLLVGILGTIFGCLLGLLVCVLQIEFALFPLDPTIYIIPAMPVDINGMDFIYVAAASIIICFTATIYPSRRAAKMLPVEAIRWE